MNESEKERLVESLHDQAIFGALGDARRQADFDQGKRESLEELAARFGVYESCCGDCGFQAGSLLEPPLMQNVVGKLDAAARGLAPFAAFFCHRDMEPCGGEFIPELDTDEESENCGLPKHVKLCPSWVQIARRKAEHANRLNTK